MSRGFVKEGDQEDVPFVPPRAFLPPGMPNYVTPSGLKALMDEREALLHERAQFEGLNENDQRVSVNLINAKLLLLEDRIASARVIDPKNQPQDEIRFGATVTLLTETTNEIQTLQLTGVDEADISKGKISFLSPLAKVIVNKKAGDKIRFKRVKDEVVFVVMKVSYE